MVALSTLRDPGRALCWVAPAAEDSELATEDPLALDYITQQVGLWMLPALTTRSTRAQAFAMVLYGLALADKAIHRYGEPHTDDTRRVLFERWERFWALATIEYLDGHLPRGHRDAMRGVRGAMAHWRGGEAPLPLDFQLISRQQELGNLGAYLAPLRRAGLVIDGTLRPSPAALDIVDAFWGEPADNKHLGRYEEYALLALDLGRKKIERSNGNLTLGRVGKTSRLTSLVARGRAAQQRRLYDALFARARDASTPAMSGLVEAATRAGIVHAQGLLDAVLAGRLGAIDDPLQELLVSARDLGTATDALLRGFDRVYAAVQAAGLTASATQVARDALSGGAMDELRAACVSVMRSPRARDLRSLPMHGGAFMRMAERLMFAEAPEALEALLGYHAEVQRERRRGQGWIRMEGEKLLLLVTSYTARPDTDRFPSYKLDAVRMLLEDTGRLTAPAAAADEEVDS